MLAAKLSHTAQEVCLHGVHAAFPLNGLQQNAAGLRRDGGAQGFQIIEVHIAEAHEQRVKLNLNLFLPRGGHGAQCAAMETLVEGNHLVARGTICRRVAVAIATRDLDDAVIALGPGVGEEDAAGDADDVFHDEPRKFLLLGNAVEVGAVHELVGLPAEGIHHDGVAVAEAAGGNARAEIHITSSLGIIKIRTFALRHRHRWRTVCLENVL